MSKDYFAFIQYTNCWWLVDLNATITHFAARVELKDRTLTAIIAPTPQKRKERRKVVKLQKAGKGGETRVPHSPTACCLVQPVL